MTKKKQIEIQSKAIKQKKKVSQRAVIYPARYKGAKRRAAYVSEKTACFKQC